MWEVLPSRVQTCALPISVSLEASTVTHVSHCWYKEEQLLSVAIWVIVGDRKDIWLKLLPCASNSPTLVPQYLGRHVRAWNKRANDVKFGHLDVFLLKISKLMRHCNFWYQTKSNTIWSGRCSYLIILWDSVVGDFSSWNVYVQYFVCNCHLLKHVFEQFCTNF